MVRDEGVEPSESRIRSEWHTPCRIPVGRPPGYRARQARIWNPRCTLCAACKLVVRVSIELTASRVSTERSTFELPNRGVPGRTRTSTTTVGGSHAIRYITRTWRHAGDSNPSFPVDGRMHSLIASTALALSHPTIQLARTFSGVLEAKVFSAGLSSSPACTHRSRQSFGFCTTRPTYRSRSSWC